MSAFFVEAQPIGVLHELHTYWKSLCGARPMPERRDIDPTDIPCLLPYVTLLDVIGDPPRFRKRLVGTAIVMKEGVDSTGTWLDEVVKPEIRAEVLNHHLQTVRERRMTCYRAEFWGEDKKRYQYARILMPLSCDGDRVNMLFGGAFFQASGE